MAASPPENTSSASSSNKLKSLFHDPDHYITSFQVYAKASAKFKVLSNWGENNFSEAVVDKLQVKVQDDEEFRALGIGSGSGEIDSKMMTKLLKRYPRINNCVVEPADGQVQRYQDRVQQLGDELKGVTYEWKKQTIDQFRKAREESGTTTKYHFISAVHSLYYADDVEDTQTWLYDQLEEGGMLLIITVSDDSGFWRLWNRFIHFEDSLMHFINSQHIRDTFTKANIPFTNQKQPSRVEITDCFEAGNQDGQLKVDFLAHVVNFHQCASADLQKTLLEYLGGPECAERKDGEVLFNNDWDAVIATKV